MDKNRSRRARLLVHKPDTTHYNPDPAYLRTLLDAITEPSLLSDSKRNTGKADQLKVAARIGVKPRTFTQYLEEGHKSQCPYAVQFALERLAGITYDTII